MSIVRHSHSEIASIANAGTKTNAIAVGDFATGSFAIPSQFTGAAITFEGSNEDDGTFTPLYTAANAAVSITVAASRAYPLPAEAMAWRFIKLVSGGAEAAARSIIVCLKG